MVKRQCAIRAREPIWPLAWSLWHSIWDLQNEVIGSYGEGYVDDLGMWEGWVVSERWSGPTFRWLKKWCFEGIFLISRTLWQPSSTNIRECRTTSHLISFWKLWTNRATISKVPPRLHIKRCLCLVVNLYGRQISTCLSSFHLYRTKVR